MNRGTAADDDAATFVFVPLRCDQEWLLFLRPGLCGGRQAVCFKVKLVYSGVVLAAYPG
jgi:hypothetical protein